MDINYLLWWQDLRITTHDVLTPFMLGISFFSVSYLLFLPTLIYWCWDKKRGLLTLATLCVCEFLTALIKLTACVYRPWIKDPRIMPAVKSLPKSYSFPSRHTAIGTVMYGGCGVAFWQKKQTKILTLLCAVLAIVTGLSRNYLGVHTPQDVFVGFLVSVGCLYAVWKVGDYFQKHPERENRCLIATAITCILALIYVLYKPYPLDYIEGKLLVSPHKMMKGAFEATGALSAFCVARYIEKTWIRFEAIGLHLKGIIYGLSGLVPLYLLFAYTEKLLKHFLGGNWGTFTWAACVVMYIIVLYPLVLKWVACAKSNR